MRKRSVVALVLGVAFAVMPVSFKIVVQWPEQPAWATVVPPSAAGGG